MFITLNKLIFKHYSGKMTYNYKIKVLYIQFIYKTNINMTIPVLLSHCSEF